MQLLSSVTLLTAALVATADAIPSFTGMLPREISELLEKRGHNLEERTGHHEFEEMAHQDDWAGFRLAGCDLDGVTLPRTGVKHYELPHPDPELKLTRVILGIGTQNYTCTPDSAPESAGAVAILYDASCLALYSPSLLHDLPNALIQVPHKNFYTSAVWIQRLFNSQKSPDEPHTHESLIVGHHFFLDSKTPTFDFRSTSENKDKILYAVKGEGVPAPEDASPGRHGQAYGTIDWLQLEAKEGDVTAQTVGYEQAYRVVTAGGKPPPSCNGFGDHIEVPYIAEYWFYN